LNIRKAENGFTVEVGDLEGDWDYNNKTYVFVSWSDVAEFVKENEIKNV